jgi:hypothetical protein
VRGWSITATGIEPMVDFDGEVMAFAVTDKHGSFSMPLPNRAGTPYLLVEASGSAGTYRDAATGETVSLGEHRLWTVLEHGPLSPDALSFRTEVEVNGVTTLAVRYLLPQLGWSERYLDMGETGAPPPYQDAGIDAPADHARVDGAIAKAVAQVGGHLRRPEGFPVFGARSAPFAEHADDTAQRLFLWHTGLSRLAAGAGAAGIQLLSALADDVADGVLDGRAKSGALSAGALVLDAWTERSAHAEAVALWLDNDALDASRAGRNRTSLTAADFIGRGRFVNLLAEDDSELFGAAPPKPFDGAPPRVTLLQPQGAVVYGVARIVVVARDWTEVQGLSAWLGDVPLADSDGAADVLAAEIDTTALADGIWPLRVLAADNLGNRAEEILAALVVSNVGPALTVTSPRHTRASEILLRFSAADAAGLASIELWQGQRRVQHWQDGLGVSFTGELAVTLASDRIDHFRLVARDGGGRESSEEWAVASDQTAPALTLGYSDYFSEQEVDMELAGKDVLLRVPESIDVQPLHDVSLWQASSPLLLVKYYNRLDEADPAAQDPAPDNLPWLNLKPEDTHTPPEAIMVIYRAFVDGALSELPCASDAEGWCPLAYAEQTLGFPLLLSHQRLGPDLTDATGGGADARLHQIDVRLTDLAGNHYDQSFYFHIQVLAGTAYLQNCRRALEETALTDMTLQAWAEDDARVLLTGDLVLPRLHASSLSPWRYHLSGSAAITLTEVARHQHLSTIYNCGAMPIFLDGWCPGGGCGTVAEAYSGPRGDRSVVCHPSLWPSASSLPALYWVANVGNGIAAWPGADIAPRMGLPALLSVALPTTLAMPASFSWTQTQLGGAIRYGVGTFRLFEYKNGPDSGVQRMRDSHQALEAMELEFTIPAPIVTLGGHEVAVERDATCAGAQRWRVH